MYNKRWLNNNGFTFLESLFNIVCFVIMIQLIIQIIIVFFHETNLREARDNMEWELFIVDLNNYFERVHSVSLTYSKKTVYYVDPEETSRPYYYFEVRDNHIVKASNLGGHEIVLPYIRNASFELNDNMLTVKAIMKSGIERKRSFEVVTYSK